MSARPAVLGLWLSLSLSLAGIAATGRAEEPGRTRLGRLDPWAHLVRTETRFGGPATTDAPADGSWRFFGDPGFGTPIHAAATFRGRLHVCSSTNIGSGEISSWGPDLGWQEKIAFYRPRVLFPFGSQLVIAGWHAFGNIKLWDGGDELIDMGAGVTGLAGSEETVVHTVILHDGFLYAGGNFWQSGPVMTGPVARWDGVAWQPNGEGLEGRVRSLVSFEGDLIAAGDVEVLDEQGSPVGVGIARWDGARWIPLDDGVGGYVRALASAGGELYAAGEFDPVGTGSVSAIARLEGSTWVPIGETDGDVHQLFDFEGELWAGGEFENVGAVPARNVAVWDGLAWRDPGGTEGGREVRSFALHEARLHLVGAFDWAGRTQAKNVARWTGNGWVTYGAGIDTEVHGIRRLATGIHAFGDFGRGGGVPVAGIARWTGENWEGYGDGFDRRVHDVAVFRGELIAAGRFTRSGNQPVSSIARWDGTAWQPLGEGLNDYGYALAVLDDVLYVGGAFTRAGDVDATALAAWDGAQWASVEGGLAGGWPFGPSVYTLETMPFRLVVGGAFEKAGSVDVSNVAFFQIGDWVAPGTGLDNWVMSLALLNEQVVAGGAFDDKLARWTGSGWERVGGLTSTVLDLSSFRDGLAIVHPGTHSGVRLYTGSTWHSLSGFTDPTALNTVEWDGGELWIGGPFTLVEGEPSRHVARWKPDPDSFRSFAVARAPEERDRSGSRLSVLTNPFRDRLTLRFGGLPGSAPAPALELFDVTGRRRARVIAGLDGRRRFEWDLGQLPAGVYFVRLRSEGAEQTRKVVKSR